MNIKHLVLFLILSLGLTQCTQVKQQDIRRIEGYWEIESVHSHGEIFTPKGGAPVVDFYHLISPHQGLKKKLHTNFSGVYERSDDKATFTIEQSQGAFYLSFEDALQKKKKKIIKINADELILFHSEKEYRYKRHQKITY